MQRLRIPYPVNLLCMVRPTRDSQEPRGSIVANSLTRAFEIFDQHIQPTATQKITAERRIDRLAQAFRHVAGVANCRLVGSMARSTTIRRYSDADILVVIDQAPGPEFEDSRELIQFSGAIVSEFSSNIRWGSNSITLLFSNWPNVDILPAVAVTELGCAAEFKIATRPGGWQSYSPESDDSLVSEAAARLGPRFKSVVRIFKWWSRSHGDIVPSFQIERIVDNLFLKDMPDYPQAFWMLFSALVNSDTYSANNETRPDVADFDIDHNDDLLRHAAVISEEAAKLAADARFERSGRLWRRLLGESFPAVAS